jgi:hypothetical protein
MGSKEAGSGLGEAGRSTCVGSGLVDAILGNFGYINQQDKQIMKYFSRVFPGNWADSTATAYNTPRIPVVAAAQCNLSKNLCSTSRKLF